MSLGGASFVDDAGDERTRLVATRQQQITAALMYHDSGVSSF